MNNKNRPEDGMYRYVCCLQEPVILYYTGTSARSSHRLESKFLSPTSVKHFPLWFLMLLIKSPDETSTVPPDKPRIFNFNTDRILALSDDVRCCFEP